MFEDKKKEKAAPKETVVKSSHPEMNETAFRVGDKVELKKLPFVVKEVKGLDITICRSDIK